MLGVKPFADGYKAVVYSSLHAVLSSRFCCTDDSHPSAGPHLSSRWSNVQGCYPRQEETFCSFPPMLIVIDEEVMVVGSEIHCGDREIRAWQ